MTSEEICGFTAVENVQNLFERGLFYLVLKLIEKHRNELLDVLLHHYVD
jgi:hypothetical protein